MKDPHKQKPKLTDAERHKRFVEMAHKLDIPDDADLLPEYVRKLIKPSDARDVAADAPSPPRRKR
jgi:hypothetical protein